jgi:hypothetical protein
MIRITNNMIKTENVKISNKSIIIMAGLLSAQAPRAIDPPHHSK